MTYENNYKSRYNRGHGLKKNGTVKRERLIHNRVMGENAEESIK